MLQGYRLNANEFLAILLALTVGLRRGEIDQLPRSPRR